MKYDRTVIAYHGCDARVAERLLRGAPFRRSENDYDWLGAGIYFWEYGADRALRFAQEKRRRRAIRRPAVIGALLQLGNCFDLMDTRFTRELSDAYRAFQAARQVQGRSLPSNVGREPDTKLRCLDAAVLNFYLDRSEQRGLRFDTVRCGFVEGPPVFDGAGIRAESHVEIAVRNPACVLGIFRPIMEEPP